MKKESSTRAMAFSFILFILLYNYAYGFEINQTFVNLRLAYIVMFSLFALYILISRRKKVKVKRK
ncbi:MAG: hypothetical protein JJU16_00910 [Alkalibacterium sp.]|nr:hypothetical protein [Alkalibacterium sp.]